MSEPNNSHSIQLREAILAHYDLEELRTLCADMGIDYDSLRGEGKAGKARELVLWCERVGRIDELEQAIRPDRFTKPVRSARAGPGDACPFVAGPKIEDPRLFVGRAAELGALTQHVSGVQPVSVNVVGERRIGKSSLLYHFYQTCAARVAQPERYAVVYLSLQSAQCQRQTDFYLAVFQALRDCPAARADPKLAAPLKKKTPDGRAFAAAMASWKERGVLPVLCLDEFEALFEHPAEFDNGFYDSLRALMDACALMLVAASREPLEVYRRQQRLTSSFFNLGRCLVLGGLTQAEATELVSRGGALSLDEQRAARQWGGTHPYLLQLACSLLWEARQQGQTLEWARTQFDLEKSKVPRPRFNIKTLLRGLLGLPARLGRAAKFIGGTWDEMSNWILGMAIILVILLAVVGLLGRAEIIELLSQLMP